MSVDEQLPSTPANSTVPPCADEPGNHCAESGDWTGELLCGAGVVPGAMRRYDPIHQ
jgi:hypothetical protein